MWSVVVAAIYNKKSLDVGIDVLNIHGLKRKKIFGKGKNYS